MRASLQEGSPPTLTGPRLLFILAALAAAAYAPILAFPFISDSFTEIPLSRALGTWHNLPSLIANPIWHFRWTYIFANSWLVQLFGFMPRPFYAASICFHVLCVWAVYATGAWNKLGWKAAGWAAAFFAVYEGHQEAVMWLAGWSELFLVLFGCACFVFWVRWLQGGRWPTYALACIAFVGCLFSKESSYVVAPLLALPLILERRFGKRGVAGLLPFLIGAAVYVTVIAVGLQTNPRATDGTFSLSAPMPLTLLESLWRLLFVWGILAAGFLLWRWRDNWKMMAVSLTWMILALVPYSFLTYMHRVPSRETYLASVGLAWLVGIALVKVSERIPVQIVTVIALLIAGVNVGILWTKKHRQFLERAAPTEALINATPYARGPIHLTCFPYPVQIAITAVEYAGGELVVDGPADKVDKPHCVSFHYKDILGNVRQITIHSAI
jgi:hypothetical protein